jgi:hypothetical protein
MSCWIRGPILRALTTEISLLKVPTGVRVQGTCELGTGCVNYHIYVRPSTVELIRKVSRPHRDRHVGS